MIYLDNSATTQLDEPVLEAMLPWLREQYGNASSQYYLGRAARVAIEDARSQVATALGAHPAEVIFTSGGTESNNAVLKSCVGESALATRIVHGATEHHAILHPADFLASCGVERVVIGVDENGRIDLNALAAASAPYTLVSVMLANNETGVLNSLSAIRDVCKGALLHTDAVQAFGKVPLDVTALGLDFASISAHKIHGPKGVGALFIRKGIDFKAHQHGGAQERNRRAGTEPVALIVGFATAVNYAMAEMETRAQHCRALIEVLRNELLASIPNIRVNTPGDDVLPTVLNISFTDAEHLDGEAILQMLDMMGVAVSNGSACVSGTPQPSHVLAAMGRTDSEARAAVRISVAYKTTLADVAKTITILTDVMRDMRVVTHK